jgi:hypothetical protein
MSVKKDAQSKLAKKVRVAPEMPMATTAANPRSVAASTVKTRAVAPRGSLSPLTTRSYEGSPAQARISAMLDEIRAKNDDLEKRAFLLLARLA